MGYPVHVDPHEVKASTAGSSVTSPRPTTPPGPASSPPLAADSLAPPERFQRTAGTSYLSHRQLMLSTFQSGGYYVVEPPLSFADLTNELGSTLGGAASAVFRPVPPDRPVFTSVQISDQLPSMTGVCANDIVRGVSIEAWTDDGTRFAIKAAKRDVSADAPVNDASITFGLRIWRRTPQDRLDPQWVTPQGLTDMINLPDSMAEMLRVKQGIERACMVAKRRYHAEAAPGPV